MMYDTIKESIDNYINERHSNILLDEDGTYRPKIYSFYAYLLDILRLENNRRGLHDLCKVKPNIIIDSMNYYINESRKHPNIKQHVYKISTLDNYFTVVREYFKHLHDNDYTNESILLEVAKWEDNLFLRNRIIDNVAYKNKLLRIKPMEPFSKEEIEELLLRCDETINNTTKEKLFSKKKHTDYKQFTSAIIIKLIYVTGIKYRVIKTIKYNDISVDSLYIKINNYKVPIPESFGEQLNKYKKFRELITDDYNISFFVKSSKSSSPDSNSYVNEYLKKINKDNTTGLAKCRLINLMEKGLPLIILKELTTFNNTIFNDCKRYINYNEDYNEINAIVYNKYKEFLLE